MPDSISSFGRGDRTRGQNNLALGTHDPFAPAGDVFDTDRSAVFQDNPGDAGARPHIKVPTMARRIDEGRGRATASSASGGDLVESATGLAARIEIGIVGQARLLAGLKPRAGQRMDVIDVGDPQRAANRMDLVAEPVVVL
jgi:hypothetical protein